MRIFSIVAALAVAAILIVTIVNRQAVLAVLGQDEPSVEVQADTQGAVPAEESGPSLLKVVAQRSTASAIDTAVALRGETNAARVVDVRSEASAIVISEPLRKGARVEAGQELCRLDEGVSATNLAQARAQLDEARARVPESEARLIQSQAQLEEAQINEVAASKLSEGGFASTTRVANAQANVATALAGVESARAGLRAAQSGIQAAQASVASAERQIEYLTMKAPFGGLLESDTAELGTLLRPGDLCATVIQLDPIKLVAFVPETEMARVKVGANASATLSNGQDNVSGKVTFLSRAADETTRTFRVEIEIGNADQTISDGQTADIRIAGDGATSHLLPQSSLTLNDDGVLGIRAVDAASQVKFYAVRLLRDTPQGVWVTGLPDQVDVIVLGQEYVIEGVKVAPTYRDLSQ